ncbi:UPF0481 protein [Ananas comosus]|uniref:UPF0481 protein n=1 Tax=Ananas comosus TaxID=4615 RepID=A0A199UQT9_ANACO|nr:UPF0481 protein [Ananas comosus]
MGTTLCTIYKVPQHIREVERHAYEPIVLSIGPYHYGTPPLQAMEKEKWNCLDYILKLNPKRDLHDYLRVIARLENHVRNCYTEDIKIDRKKFLQILLLDGCFILVTLHGTVEIVPPLRQEVYGTDVNNNKITEKDEMERKGVSLGHNKNEKAIPEDKTLKNGCANKENLVLEVEAGQASASLKSTQDNKPECEKKDQYPENCVLLGLWNESFAAHDLLLLENQIPSCVVKSIYQLVAGKDAAFAPVTNSFAKCMEHIVRYYPTAIKELERPKDFHHLLHLCHMYFRPSQKPEEGHQHQVRPHTFQHFLQFAFKYLKLGHRQEENMQNLTINKQMDCLQSAQERWHRAVQYYEAGIEFTRKEFNKCNPHSLLDIEFRNGVMDIPCLPVDEHTSCLFRNFIAFEQTCPQFGNDFTTYVVFMSQFMSMSEDVTLLAQRGIIEHQLRSDKEVSTLFTKLVKDVVFDFGGNYYLKSIFRETEAHYQSRLNMWMAWLRHNHFSNPWLALAALAAAIMLFCTILQTLIAVYSYMKPPVDNSGSLD